MVSSNGKNLEDLTIRSTDGRTIFKFDSLDKKQEFINILEKMVAKTEEIEQKNYTCGECSAYPCFRFPEESEIGGLCFQLVRQCRQECSNYNTHGHYPASGGDCRIDGVKVEYCQECHIQELRNEKIK